MIFDSIENLPMRLFLKILESGDLKHLGDIKEPQLVWDEILEEYKEIDPDNQFKDVLNTQKEIAFLNCKYNAINISIQCLSVKKNDELLEVLKLYGYVIRDSHVKEDLITAKGYTNAILIKIKKLQTELDKEGEEDKFSFDRAIIKLNTIFGFKIAEANTVTVSEYYSLKEEAKNLINQRKKENGRGHNK